MNRAHHWICRSRWWKHSLATDLIPWALEGLSLGPTTLEIGCGPGVSAALLARWAKSLTCVECDPSQAFLLSNHMRGTETLVLCGDASALPVDASSFHSVLAFTMLHHVAPAGKQDALFREVARVLKPGGVFAGTDSCDGRLFRILHWGDRLQPPDPASLPLRLRAAGFDDVDLAVRKREFRFRARRGSA